MPAPKLRLPHAPGNDPNLVRMAKSLEAWADQLQQFYAEQHEDLLRSKFVERESMYWATPAATTLSTGVWTKAAGTTKLKVGTDFSLPSDNFLVHTGQTTETYLVLCDFTVTCAANNQTIHFGLGLNGMEPEVDSERHRYIQTGTQAGIGATHTEVEMKPDDHISFLVKNVTSTGAVTIQRAALSLVRVV